MTARWQTVSLDALARVPPRLVHAYLGAQGWEQVRPYGDMGNVYASADHSEEALVPAAAHFADYAIRLNEIIAILSRVENRDGRAILRDITLTGYDLLRVRLPEASEDGSVSIAAGVTLFHEAHNLLLAAACAAVRPQRFFRAGRNQQASDYMRRVRLGQTEPGSFVANLLSPVPPILDAGQRTLFDTAPEEPFERQVTRKLASSLRSTREAIAAVDQGKDIQAFEQKIPQGISANLCDAITSLLGVENGKMLDLSISWATIRNAKESSMQARFMASDLPILREASRTLKDRQEHTDERIEGYVTNLAREQAEHQGRVTLKAVVEGAMRSIRADFSPADYGRITDAHNRRLVISLEGDLRREGQRWTLHNPRDLEIFENDD